MADRTLTWIGDVWGWDSWWGYDSDITPARAARELEDEGQITILLSSGGGDALAGREIASLIRKEADRINIEVLGLAASAASIIAIAAGKCVMHPGSLYMVHEPTGGAWGNAKALEATASMLRAYRAGMASDYATVSGMSKDDALSAMDKETWYTDEEAVDAGFASKVLGDSEAKASATRMGKIVTPENAIVTALTTPRKKTYALPERVAAVVARVGGDMGKKAKGAAAKPVKAGDNLAARLEQEIPSDGDERQETIERMADAADIEVSTVNQILSGEIDCPPRTRLEGFAEALDVSVDSLISAAEEDGCTNYSGSDDDMEAKVEGNDKPKPEGDAANQVDEQVRQVTEERDQAQAALEQEKQTNADLTKRLEALEAEKPDEGAMAAVQTELETTKASLTRTQAELDAQKEVKSELTKRVEALEKERHDKMVSATLRKHQARGAITAAQAKTWEARLNADFETMEPILAEMPSDPKFEEHGTGDEPDLPVVTAQDREAVATKKATTGTLASMGYDPEDIDKATVSEADPGDDPEDTGGEAD